MHLVLIGVGVEILSASRKLRPNLLATSRPTSDLPEPDTPVRTIARAFPGDEPIAVTLELILGELGSAIAESIFSANVRSGGTRKPAEPIYD